jgi:hypothetical protein
MSIKLTYQRNCVALIVSAALITSCVPSTTPLEITAPPVTVDANTTLLPPVTSTLGPYPIDTAEVTTVPTPIVPPAKLTDAAQLSQTPPVSPAATSTPILGIVEGVAPPYNTEEFVSGGPRWVGYIDSTLTFVYAGARGTDHQQGVVIVENPTVGGWYDTSSKDGVLKIIAASGSLLTLTAEDGSIYQFDVNSVTFITPTGDPNTTITPNAVSTTEGTAAP